MRIEVDLRGGGKLRLNRQVRADSPRGDIPKLDDAGALKRGERPAVGRKQ